MLLAFGDTHRSTLALAKAAAAITSHKPQLFVHTGDNYGDFIQLKRLTNVKGYGVRGNCDPPFFSGAPEEKIFQYAGINILLTHGHKYGVKHSQERLLKYGVEIGVQVIIYGHSHVQTVNSDAGILMVNPGSIPLPRGGGPGGYGIITVVDGKPTAQLIRI